MRRPALLPGQTIEVLGFARLKGPGLAEQREEHRWKEQREEHRWKDQRGPGAASRQQRSRMEA